jgi:hypothetical protein
MRWDAWARLGSLVAAALFVVLLVLGFVLSGDTPSVTASTTKVLSYYQAHSDRIDLASYLVGLSIVFGLFWFGSLRAYLRESPAAERLMVVFVMGAVLFAVSGAIVSGLGFALSDSPKHLTPAAAQALNTLESDLQATAFLGGMAVMWVASGLAIVRSRLLPAWLGWVAIVLGVVSVTPIGWLTVFALVVWTVIVSALVYVRTAPTAAVPEPARS